MACLSARLPLLARAHPEALMSHKTSPARRAAFFRALFETGNQTLACERDAQVPMSPGHWQPRLAAGATCPWSHVQ